MTSKVTIKTIIVCTKIFVIVCICFLQNTLNFYRFGGSRPKGNTDTSGLVSGLVTIRSGDCGAKFKNVGNLKAILISSLYSYPEANLYQFANHPEGFQFTIPNPDLNSVSIS